MAVLGSLRAGRPGGGAATLPSTPAPPRDGKIGELESVHRIVRRLPALTLALALGARLCPAATEPPGETGIVRMLPSPPGEAAAAGMRRWHHDYRTRMSPVLRQWESLARATRQRPGDRLVAGCRSLAAALRSVERGRLPTAPDPSVSLHLEETLRALREASRSCTQGAWFLTAWRLHQAEESWRELRGRLLVYGLAP